jgi:hypothetical protein
LPSKSFFAFVLNSSVFSAVEMKVDALTAASEPGWVKLGA